MAVHMVAVFSLCGLSVLAVAGCSASQQVATVVRPQVRATGVAGSRLDWAAPVRSKILRAAGTVLLHESFEGEKTQAGAWAWNQDACLTGGDSNTPSSSIPACFSAPEYVRGQSALQLTPAQQYQRGFVASSAPLPTAAGLDFVFTLCAYAASSFGGDGALLWLSDASLKAPARAAGDGGNLGYIASKREVIEIDKSMRDVYLGIGFDDFGDFAEFLPGGPGYVTDTVDIAAGVAAGYEYLGGVTNGSGQPASLPFELDSPSATRPVHPPTIDVSLTPAGLLEVAIDIHDGNGFVMYYSGEISGAHGEPAVPPSVRFGFTASTGYSTNYYQISKLTVSTLQESGFRPVR
jgi:hypothetical protein